VDFFDYALITNIFGFMVVVMFLLLEPLPGWVLKSILWISFLGSSPWLWED